MNPDIRRYLDEHGATYTREALRQGLIAAGHDPLEIDEALRAHEAEQTRTRPSDAERRTFSRWALWLHVGALVAVVLLLVLLKGVEAFGVALIGAAVLGVALLIGWAISSLIGRAVLPRAGLPVALILPVVSAVLLSGTCLGLMNATIQAPPRKGSMQLEILAPRAFDGSGVASCFLQDGTGGTTVNAEQLGTLDGKNVAVYLNTYGAGDAKPVSSNSSASLAIVLGGAADAPGETYTTIPTTQLEVNLGADRLSGTIQFEGLGPEPIDRPPGETAPEPISGTVGWTCK